MVASTLHSANGGLTTAQSTLNQALGVAKQAGLDIGNDGSVSWNLPQTLDLLTNPTGLLTIGRIAGQVSDLIGRSLDHASIVDSHTAAELAKLSPQGTVATEVRLPAGGGGETDPASADEQKLRDALKQPINRTAIDEVAADLERHKNDHAFLTSFFLNGGADDLAQLAAVLEKDDTRNQHATLLSDDSQKVLKEAADALASATNLPTLQASSPGDPSPLAALSNPSDQNMWSVGMLAKYGPPGSQWNSTFLNILGSSMLDWRERVRQRPSYSEGNSILGNFDSAYSDSGNTYPEQPNWWNSLGISFQDGNNWGTQSGSAQSRADLALLQGFDPSYAILDKVAQNPSAAAELVGGTDGAQHAKELMSPYWGTPGHTFTDESQHAGAVIAAATGLTPNARPQASSDLYTQSVANVFSAVNDLEGGKGDTPSWIAADYAGSPPAGSQAATIEKYPETLPTAMRRQLTGVATLYVSDLASSSSNKSGSAPTPETLDGWDRKIVMSSPGVVKSVLQEIARDPSTAGTFHGVIKNAIGHAATVQTSNPGSESAAVFNDLGKLLGMQDDSTAKQAYDSAYNAQYQVAERRALLDQVIGIASNAPAPEKLSNVVGWGQVAVSAAAPAIESLVFPDPSGPTPTDVVNDQTKLLQDTQQDIKFTVAMGVVASPSFQWPPACRNEWWNIGADGKPHITNMDSFWAWWRNEGESTTDLQWEDIAGDGYSQANPKYTAPPMP
ncbi:MAG TPA: hypothetical protein VFG87_29270 [Amycolatopsis sp.]|nr:hypothetical protein [Amycolatopsis sp.]